MRRRSTTGFSLIESFIHINGLLGFFVFGTMAFLLLAKYSSRAITHQKMSSWVSVAFALCVFVFDIWVTFKINLWVEKKFGKEAGLKFFDVVCSLGWLFILVALIGNVVALVILGGDAVRHFLS